MLRNLFLCVLVAFNVGGVFSQNAEGKSIKVLNEVNEKMTEFKFNVEEGLNESDIDSWIETTKAIAVIEEVKIIGKKSQKEVTWTFKHSPTLKDFKYLFAKLDIQQITLQDKIMSAVEFTTFGFSNDSNKK